MSICLLIFILFFSQLSEEILSISIVKCFPIVIEGRVIVCFFFRVEE